MIRILVTGGTFDKEYNELTGALFFRNTKVPEMLRLGRNHAEVAVQTLMMMDSLDMLDVHRSQIVEACALAAEPHIVITHGTDTIVETARALAERCSTCPGKTIVLTGAMVPGAWKILSDSERRLVFE